MKTVWIASFAMAAATSAMGQSTIYKHVDESGRITYSNKPMKGAAPLELEPLTTIPSTPAGMLVNRSVAAPDKPEVRPVAAIVTPLPKPMLAAVEPSLQRKRDEERRRILVEELAREEESLAKARDSLLQERQNPALIAAVRMAQQASDPSPSQLAEFRNNVDRASGRIRGLQASVAEHEKNVEALRKELGALKL